MYRKIGGIKGFSEIPWGEEIVIMGTIGKGWYWRVKGKFIKDENGCRFLDECGVNAYFSPNDFISLNVLDKIAHKPEGSAH